MTLSWKDLVAGGLAILMAGFSYLYVTGYHFPVITGYRGAILVLLALGIGMCALSPGNANYSNLWIITASVLGVIALVLVAAGLITGTKTMFLATAAVILILWVLATLRHLIGA